MNSIIASSSLSEAARDYLQARAFSDHLIDALGITVWPNVDIPCPDPQFSKQFGAKGEALVGHLITPLRSPRGSLIGMEARTYQGKKQVSKYLLPIAEWNPVWIGADSFFSNIYNGGEVWVVEGLFDLAALNRVVPPTDAVLSSLRAKLTDKHIHFLKRFASRVNMVYDRDQAGRSGTLRALKDLRNASIPCRDIPYRGGKDPGEIWDKSGDFGLKEAFSFVTGELSLAEH